MWTCTVWNLVVQESNALYWKIEKKDSDRSMKRNIKKERKFAKDMCVTVEWSNIFATVVLVKGGEKIMEQNNI